MVQVNGYERKVQLRAQNQQSVRVNTSDDTFGGNVGRAAEGVGAAMFKVADAVDFKQQLEGDANAREAFNAYRYDHREAMRAPETGFLNQTGGNASGVQETAEQRLGTLRETHAEGLDPRARQKFDEMVDGLQDQAHGSLLTHTSNESRNYIVNQRQATVEGYLEEAATNWSDQELFDENVVLAMQEQDELANLQGWDDATRANAQATLLSGAMRGRIVQAAADDPIAAQALLENARDVLSAEDEYALDNSLEGLVREARVNEFTRGFVVQGGPRGGNDAIIASLSGTESGGNDRAYNDEVGAGGHVGHGGDLQFGTARLADASRAGIVPAGMTALEYSRTDAAFQERVENWHVDDIRNKAETRGLDRYIGQEIGGVVITMEGIIAMSHLGGIGGATQYLESNGRYNPSDAYGTSLSDYARAHGGAGVTPSVPSGNSDVTTFSGRVDYTGVDAMMSAANADNTPTNRRMYAHLGEEASSIIQAAQMTPSMAASIALSDRVMNANPNFAGMTVGEVYDSIAAAVGDDPASRQGSNYFDVQGAYEAALAIEDPQMRADVLASINTMASLQDRARNEGRRAAAEDAWEQYATTGQTDFSPEVRMAMGQSGWTAFQSAVQSDQRGTTVTDPDTWEMLTRLASSNPQAFADLNLAGHYGNLSQSDRQHFVVTQEATRSSLNSAEVDADERRNLIDYGAINTQADAVYAAFVDTTTPTQMDAEQRQRRLRFQQELAAMTRDFYDKNEREPNEREVRELATVLTMPILYTPSSDARYFGRQSDGALFDAGMRAAGSAYEINVKYDNIPMADRSRIAAQLTAVLPDGETPTEDDITYEYEQQQLFNVGLPADIDVSGVPQWLIDEERRANPEATDDEIVEIYRLYVMSR